MKVEASRRAFPSSPHSCPLLPIPELDLLLTCTNELTMNKGRCAVSPSLGLLVVLLPATSFSEAGRPATAVLLILVSREHSATRLSWGAPISQYVILITIVSPFDLMALGAIEKPISSRFNRWNFRS